jgi:MFS family permease
MLKIATEYELSYFAQGILTACFMLPYSLLQIFFGNLARHVSQKILMSIGLALNSAAFLAICFVGNVQFIAVLLFLAGVGGSVYHPIGIPS